MNPYEPPAPEKDPAPPRPACRIIHRGTGGFSIKNLAAFIALVFIVAFGQGGGVSLIIGIIAGAVILRLPERSSMQPLQVHPLVLNGEARAIGYADTQPLRWEPRNLLILTSTDLIFANHRDGTETRYDLKASFARLFNDYYDRRIALRDSRGNLISLYVEDTTAWREAFLEARTAPPSPAKTVTPG